MTRSSTCRSSSRRSRPGRLHRRDGLAARYRQRERLREEGVTEDELARIHAPIGLKLGSRTPEEVAVAIAADLSVFRATSTSRRKRRYEAREQLRSAVVETGGLGTPHGYRTSGALHARRTADRDGGDSGLEGGHERLARTDLAHVRHRHRATAWTRAAARWSSTRKRERSGPRGGAQAAIQSSLSDVPGGTRVDIVTDLTLSGAVAQYGPRDRPGRLGAARGKVRRPSPRRSWLRRHRKPRPRRPSRL